MLTVFSTFQPVCKIHLKGSNCAFHMTTFVYYVVEPPRRMHCQVLIVGQPFIYTLSYLYKLQFIEMTPVLSPIYTCHVNCASSHRPNNFTLQFYLFLYSFFPFLHFLHDLLCHMNVSHVNRSTLGL